MNKEIARKALETALELGASDCRINLAESTQTSISYLNGEIEKLQQSSSSAMGIAIFTEGRYGSFSTNRMDMDELRPFLRRCIESCRLLTPDNYRTMPDRNTYYKNDKPDLQLLDGRYQSIPFADKAAFLKATDAEADKSDSRLISTACDWDDCLKSEYIIDSRGLEVEDCRTAYSVSCECTVRGHGEARPQNNWFEGSVFFDRLPSGCGRKAYERTVPMIDSRKLPSGKYNIILENTVSARAVSAVIEPPCSRRTPSCWTPWASGSSRSNCISPTTRCCPDAPAPHTTTARAWLQVSGTSSGTDRYAPIS